MGLVDCRGSNTRTGFSAADVIRGTLVCPECTQQSKFGFCNSRKMTAKLIEHKRLAAGKKPADTRRRRQSALAERISWPKLAA